MIALVTQQAILFNDTVKSNIGYGNQAASFDDIVSAAKSPHMPTISHSCSSPELRYDHRRAEVKLSGGQRQRIAIGRCWKTLPASFWTRPHRPSTPVGREVQIALDMLMKDRTSFVIAHRLSTIMNADKIIVLKNGGSSSRAGTRNSWRGTANTRVSMNSSSGTSRR